MRESANTSQLASLLLADLLASADPQVSADRLASRAAVALLASVDVKDAELSHENQVTSPSLRKRDKSGKQHARRRTGKRTIGVREMVKRRLQPIETEHARIEKGAVQTVYQLSKKACHSGCYIEAETAGACPATPNNGTNNS